MKSSRVLIIEDDQWFSALFKKTLESAGYAVGTARNAIEGMKQIDAQNPDAIILDFFMPGPNAMVLLHELQSYTDTSKIPVIFCTNSAADIPTESASSYGVKVILDKTLMHPNDIVAAVRRVL